MIETLSELQTFASSFYEKSTDVAICPGRLVSSIERKLAEAELRGEQKAQMRALELASVSPKVTIPGYAPGELLARIEKLEKNQDASRNYQAAILRIEELRDELHGMRGVFMLDGQENAAELRKRVEDLERNLGPDLKNDVAQRQIAKYQGLSKRIEEHRARLDAQGEALNDHLRRIEALEAADKACTDAHHSKSRRLDDHNERVRVLEAHPERLGSSAKHADQQVEALRNAVGELQAWRANVVKLEHVGALDERLAKLEAWRAG